MLGELLCDISNIVRYGYVTGNYVLNDCRLPSSATRFYLHPHSVECNKILLIIKIIIYDRYFSYLYNHDY